MLKQSFYCLHTLKIFVCIKNPLYLTNLRNVFLRVYPKCKNIFHVLQGNAQALFTMLLYQRYRVS